MGKVVVDADYRRVRATKDRIGGMELAAPPFFCRNGFGKTRKSAFCPLHFVVKALWEPSGWAG